MALSDTNFKLTGPRLKAVELVAQDAISDEAIAAEVGIAKRTLEHWKGVPIFAELVAESRTAMAEAVRKQGIAAKQNRIDSYVSDFILTAQIMAERAEDSDISEGPGGKTGLVVRTIKGLGSGDNFTTVAEFAFDAALLTARQTLRRQIAEELGEWQDNLNLSGDLTTTVRILGGVDPEDI